MYKSKVVMLFACLSTLALGQVQDSYPSKPIRIIAPFLQGGATDIAARSMALRLRPSLGQPVQVENMPGSGGMDGTTFVAKAPADGYTLLMATETTHAPGPTTSSNRAFDPIRDFEPITLVSRAPNLLVVGPKVPVESVEQLIALAKTTKLAVASLGKGSLGYRAGELLEVVAGVGLVHTSHPTGRAIQAKLVSGEVHLAIVSAPVGILWAKDGNARVIAVAGKRRLPLLSAVPSTEESGLPGFEVANWTAIFAPAGTSPGIVGRLGRELKAVLEYPETRDLYAQMGMEVGDGSSRTLAELLRAEQAMWSRLQSGAGKGAE